jgi:hypothetical protein
MAFVYSLEKEITAFNKLCSYRMHGRYSALKKTLQLEGVWDSKLARYGALSGIGLGMLYTVSKVFTSGVSVKKFSWQINRNTILGTSFMLLSTAYGVYR